MRTSGQAPQRLGRATRVQQLGGLALVFFLARGGGHASHALQERLVRLGHSLRRRRTNGRRRFRIVPIAFVILFDNVFEDETVPMAGNRANETRLARVVTEDPGGSCGWPGSRRCR